MNGVIQPVYALVLVVTRSAQTPPLALERTYFLELRDGFAEFDDVIFCGPKDTRE